MDELIQGYLEGNLSPDEAKALLVRLKAEPEVRDSLFEALRADIIIREAVWESEHVGPHFGSLILSQTGDQEGEIGLNRPPDSEKVHQIKVHAEQQLQAFLIEQDRLRRQQAMAMRPSPRFEIDLPRLVAKAARTLVMLKRATQVAVVLAVLVLVVLSAVHYILAHRVVATLGQTMHAQWDAAPDGNDLRPGELTLHQGFAEITFKKGARVLLQAPCRFRLRSPNKMDLDEGTLTARVSKEAVGFSVVTPRTSVVDFGTEFGVAANAAQGSEVHVFDGEVGVGPSLRSRSDLKRLERGQAAQVHDATSLEVGAMAGRSKLFFRKMPENDQLGIPGKRMNLADIVGGGNGYGTGNLGGSGYPAIGTINQFTGVPDDPFRPLAYRAAGRWYDKNHVEAGNVFVPVSMLPYVDGVFVPDGGQTACIVSSRGHVFRECPDTEGVTKWNVINGWRYRNAPVSTYVNTAELSQTQGISLHANLGITFDLDQIRQGLGEVKVRRFSARAGLPLPQEEDIGEVDVWVLIDGQVRFVQKDIRSSQMFDIGFDIASEERFLTLVATDSETGPPARHPSNCDRCFFAEPVLELGLDREANR